MLVSRTPLRFSLIGGGSDLYEYINNYGPCKIISMTLEPSMYVTYSPRNLYSGVPQDVYGSNIRLSYTQTELVESIENLQHDLVRETLKVVREVDEKMSLASFEMTTVGDIPSRGAGLGSSSALIVGILALFTENRAVHPYEEMEYRNAIATTAFIIETKRLGKNIGVQDHLSATFGGLRKYHIECDGQEKPLQAIGQAHWLADNLCAFRLPGDRANNATEAPKHALLDALKEDMASRAVYLSQTVDMVDDCWSAIYAQDLEAVGGFLRKAWELKKKSHAFLDKDVERVYDIGMNAGAYAGKVSGSMSSGAGHLFFLAPPGVQTNIRRALGMELNEMQVNYYPHGSYVKEI